MKSPLGYIIYKLIYHIKSVEYPALNLKLITIEDHWMDLFSFTTLQKILSVT